MIKVDINTSNNFTNITSSLVLDTNYLIQNISDHLTCEILIDTTTTNKTGIVLTPRDRLYFKYTTGQSVWVKNVGVISDATNPNGRVTLTVDIAI